MYASSILGTPHFGCEITTTFLFPDLYIKPIRQTSGFPGCAIDTEPFHEIPNNKFFIFVDRRLAGASATVVWENLSCPAKTIGLVGSLPSHPITYFDYCGNYTISAETAFPIYQANCRVRSDEYPIPDWTIVQDVNSGKCTITKYEGRFSIFVDSKKTYGVASVAWEECPTQFILQKGNQGNKPIQYYASCGNYTISAGTISPVQAACNPVQSDEYPIPSWTIELDAKAKKCTIDKDFEK